MTLVPSVPRVWRERVIKYRLIGSKCKKCGAVFYPPRPVCRNCLSREMELVKLPEEGRLINYTVIRYSPRGFEKEVPYIIGVVELKNGVKVLAQIVDITPEELKIGMEVEATFRRLREQGPDGVIEYGLKFRPKIE